MGGVCSAQVQAQDRSSSCRRPLPILISAKADLYIIGSAALPRVCCRWDKKGGVSVNFKQATCAVILALGSVFGVALSGAQQPGKMTRVGFLGTGPAPHARHALCPVAGIPGCYVLFKPDSECLPNKGN